MKGENLSTYFAMAIGLAVATWCIYDMVILGEYWKIILVAINGITIWFGLETIRLKRLRRKVENKQKNKT